MKALGVGPDAIPRKKLTADNLAAAIRTLTSSEAMRDHAAALSQKIATEDGVAEAVRVITEQRWLA